MSRFIYILSYPFRLVITGLVYLYKHAISPLLPHMCRYTPTCSTYFLQSVKEYGIIVGVGKGLKRIFRCNPVAKGGFDPVIPNIKGNVKWIL